MGKKQFCGSNKHFRFAGVHLIVEIWNARYLNSLPRIRKILLDSVRACRATLLKIDLHEFSPNQGVSGVAILKESHISIHTWPEYHYAALDIFVCGTLDPYRAIPVIKKGFSPKKIQVVEMKRGIF